MYTTFSELILSVLITLGLGAPAPDAQSVAEPGDLRPAVAADERAGNFDPNGFTSSSLGLDGEEVGPSDPEELAPLPPWEDEALAP